MSTSHTRSGLLRMALLLAGALLALGVLAPGARAGTSSDMTSALASVDGTTGWVVKRLTSSGATTLSAKNQSFVFEPASAITVLHHLVAQLRIQSDQTMANALTQAWILPSNSGCPTIDWSPGIFFGDPLQTALSKMSLQSNNASVEGVRHLIGEAAINQTAENLGGTKTLTRRRHGCTGEALAKPDRLTLRDASKLYRAAFAGTVLTAQRRQDMWARMPSNSAALKRIAQDVAQAKLAEPLPPAMAAGLKSVYKSGNYNLCGQSGCKRYIAVAGYAEIPRNTRYGVPATWRYTFGFFMHRATVSTSTTDAAGDAAMQMILREQITNALDSWL